MHKRRQKASADNLDSLQSVDRRQHDSESSFEQQKLISAMASSSKSKPSKSRRPSSSANPQQDKAKLIQRMSQLRQAFLIKTHSEQANSSGGASYATFRQPSLGQTELNDSQMKEINRAYKRTKRNSVSRKRHQLGVQNFNGKWDTHFVKYFLQPYLSAVYFALIKSQGKTYLSIDRLKQYLNLPPLLASRLVGQINENGDERIDHDEFVSFFLKMLMGSLDQRLLIAFRCYDQDGNELIEKQEVQLILKNIPMVLIHREGLSFIQEENVQSRVEQIDRKLEDFRQVQEFTDSLFMNYPDGIYFDEFSSLVTTVTSELFFSIFNCIYNYVPLAKNFFIMRKNFSMFLQSEVIQARGYIIAPPSLTQIMPPITKKLLDRLLIQTLSTQGSKQSLLAWKNEGNRSQSVSHQLPDSVKIDLEYLHAQTRGKRKSFLEETKNGENSLQPPPTIKHNAHRPTQVISINKLDGENSAPTFQRQNLMPFSRNNFNAIKEVDESSENSTMNQKSSPQKTQSFAPNFKFGMLTTHTNTKYTNTMATTRSKGSPNPAQSSSIDKSPIEQRPQNEEAFSLMNSPEQPKDLDILRMSEKTHSNPSSVTEEESFEESSSSSQQISRGHKKSAFGQPLTQAYQTIEVSSRSPLPKSQFFKKTSPTTPTRHQQMGPKEGTHQQTAIESASTFGSYQFGGIMKQESSDTSRAKARKERGRNSISLKEAIQLKKRMSQLEKEKELNAEIRRKLYQRNKGLISSQETEEDAQATVQEIQKSQRDRKFSVCASIKGVLKKTTSQIVTNWATKEQENHKTTEDILDGFQVPLQCEMHHLNTPYFQLMSSGCFRQCFLILSNHELYLYSSKSADHHEEMIVLTPGVFVKKKSPVTLSPTQKMTVEEGKLHPIEVFVGGKLGNLGVPSFLDPATPSEEGVFTFFFSSPDIQSNWMKQLEQVTGSYKIQDFYQVSKKATPQNLDRLKRNSTIKKAFVLQPQNGAKRKSFTLMSAMETDFEDDFDNPEDGQKFIKSLKVLGIGKSGSIIAEGIHKHTKKPVAIKIINKSKRTRAQIDRIREMISIHLIALSHNVVRLEDYFENEDRFFICYELQQSVTLLEFIRMYRTTLKEEHLRELFQRILRTIESLHEQGIILRDLDANGLLINKGTGDTVPRLICLQSAQIMSLSSTTSGLVGDVRFRAPEVIQLKPYGFKADSWSLGVIFYYMLMSELPFEGNLMGEEQSESSSSQSEQTEKSGEVDIIAKIESEIEAKQLDMLPLKQKGISNAAIDLLLKLLNRNSQARLEVKTALKHHWFSMNLDAKEEQQRGSRFSSQIQRLNSQRKSKQQF